MKTLLVALLALLPLGASAQGFAAGLKLGGAFPGLFSELDAGLAAEVEAGLLFLDGRLEVDLTVGWARPPASLTASDPRFDGGDFEWQLSQDLLALGVLGRWRFLPLTSAFNVYGALGPRLYLLRTVVEGESGGESLGENRQYDTQLGYALAVGGEFKAGPGRVVGELHLGGGPLQGLITGEVASSALGLMVGYRVLF